MFKYKITAGHAPKDIVDPDEILEYQRKNTFLDKTLISRIDLFEYSIPKMEIDDFNGLFTEVGGNDQIRTIFSQTKEKDNGLANSKISNLLSPQVVITVLREGANPHKEVFDLVLCDGYSKHRKILKTIPNSELQGTNLRLGALANRDDMYSLGDNLEPGNLSRFMEELTFVKNLILVDDNSIKINMTALHGFNKMVQDLASKRNGNRDNTHASLKFEGLIVVE